MSFCEDCATQQLRKQAASSQHSDIHPLYFNVYLYSLFFRRNKLAPFTFTTMKWSRTYASCAACWAPPMKPYLSAWLPVKPFISESESESRELSSPRRLLLTVRMLPVSTGWRPLSVWAILPRKANDSRLNPTQKWFSAYLVVWNTAGAMISRPHFPNILWK